MGDLPRVLRGQPALRTWILTLVLSLTATTGAAIASHFVEADWNAQIAVTRAQEVQTVESIPPLGQRKGPAVIIFGTSLVEAATLRAGLQQEFPPSVQIIVFVGKLGARTPIEDLVPVMRKAHPDLVLIETNSMLVPGEDPDYLRRLRHLELALSLWFRGAKLRPGPATPAAKHMVPSCSGLVLRKSADVGNVASDYRGWYNILYLDRLPALLELQAAGIRVGVLDMPRAAELEAAAPNLVTFRNRMNQALGERGVEMWIAPDVWPADLFCDLSHLNHDGAILFDRWLSGRLRQALNLPQ